MAYETCRTCGCAPCECPRVWLPLAATVLTAGLLTAAIHPPDPGQTLPAMTPLVGPIIAKQLQQLEQQGKPAVVIHKGWAE